MKLLGSQKLIKQIKSLPDETRLELQKSIQRQVNKGVRVARTLAPVDTGDLKAGISGEVKVSDNGIYGVVNAAVPEKEAQIKARAVEFGRKDNRSSARPFIQPTQAYLAKTYKGAIKRAIKKAVRSAASG